MNLDEACREASERLSAQTDERINAYRLLAVADAERVRRSFGQKWRWLTKQLLEDLHEHV